MSNIPIPAGAVSANDVFKSRYNNSLRWSGLIAALLMLAMAWFSPKYTPHPYQLPAEIFELTEVEIIYEQEEPPAVAAAPVIPPEILPVDNEDPGAVEPPDLGRWPGFYAPRPTLTVPRDDGFVASSTKPVLLSQAKPHYPEVARLARIEGTVIVKVLVDVDGTVKDAAIVQGVHPLLNKAALKAARRCTFEAGRQRQLKVATWVAVPYNFRLR